MRNDQIEQEFKTELIYRVISGECTSDMLPLLSYLMGIEITNENIGTAWARFQLYLVDAFRSLAVDYVMGDGLRRSAEQFHLGSFPASKVKLSPITHIDTLIIMKQGVIEGNPPIIFDKAKIRDYLIDCGIKGLTNA